MLWASDVHQENQTMSQQIIRRLLLVLVGRLTAFDITTDMALGGTSVLPGVLSFKDSHASRYTPISYYHLPDFVGQ